MFSCAKVPRIRLPARQRPDDVVAAGIHAMPIWGGLDGQCTPGLVVQCGLAQWPVCKWPATRHELALVQGLENVALDRIPDVT